MGLADVDHHEVRAVLVLAVQLFDVPRMASERPAGETAEYQDDGLGPDQLRQRDLGLAVVGLQGEVGRRLVELRPGLKRADLLAEQAADERGLGRPARAGRRPCDAGGGVNASCRSASDRKPWPPLSVAGKNASSSSRVTLPLPSRSSRENTHRAGRRRQCAGREVEIGRGERLVVIAVESGEIGVAAGEFGSRDLAVAVMVVALAGRRPSQSASAPRPCGTSRRWHSSVRPEGSR